MLKKPMLLNAMLFVVSGMLFYNLNQMWLIFSSPPTADRLVEEPSSVKASADEGEMGETNSAPLSAYKVVGKQNVFRPQRREWTPPPPKPAPPKPPPAPKPQKPEPPPPPPLPDPVVMGIILEEDGERIAIMQGHHREAVTVRSRRRGRIPSRIVADRVGTYHEGDTISEAIIREIQEDKVIIEREGEKIELVLGNKPSTPISPAMTRSPAKRYVPTPPPYKYPKTSSPSTYGQPDVEQPSRRPTRSERLEEFRSRRRRRLGRGRKEPFPGVEGGID